jgi:hypothetical protein
MSIMASQVSNPSAQNRLVYSGMPSRPSKVLTFAIGDIASYAGQVGRKGFIHVDICRAMKQEMGEGGREE